MLQAAIKNLNSCIQNSQQLHVEALKSAIVFQRTRYCSLAGHLAKVSDKYLSTANSEMKLCDLKEKLNDFSGTAKTLTGANKELVKPKTRTLIDVFCVY